MRLFKIFPVITQFVLVLGYSSSQAQTPANDLNWQLDSVKSDEFNRDTVNTSLWHLLDCPSGDCCNYGGGTAYEKGNVSDSGGLLRLRIDGPGYAPIPCNRETYATGAVVTDSGNYSYGYFEIYAQLPGYYYNGNPIGQKFAPSFWTYYGKFDTTCMIIHNEIDILEPNGRQYANANTNVCGWWFQNGHCGDYKVGQYQFNSPVPLFAGFHKYAAEWTSNSIVFFFDDLPFFENYNSPTMTMNPQKVVIAPGVDDTADHFVGTPPFPLYMNVDYFRHYTLKLDCGTSAIILDNAGLASYVYSVKSDITFGSGNDTISLNNSDVKYFRAVNSITINGTFTAPLGSELGLIPSGCH